MKSKGLKKKLFIATIILVIVAVGSVSIFNKSKAKEVTVEVKVEVKNVKTQKVAVGAISTNIEYASNLKPTKQVMVLPKTGGKVATVDVNVGDKVNVGQTLFTLDVTDFSAQLQQMQAGVSAASANLEKTSDSGLAQQILQGEQSVGKLQIQNNSVKDTYDRTQKLYDVGAGTKKDLDDVKAQYDAVVLDLKAAQDSLNLLKTKIGPQSTKAAAAAVDQAQAGVSTVQIQINNATITSPISGIVSTKDVEVGQLAGGQSGSVTIIDSTALIAEISVPDKMLAKIKVGQSIPVAINALQDKKIVGVIDNISPNTNDKNNFYIVKIKIDNLNGEITSGMFAKVSLPAENKTNILTVPNETIKMENGVDYVYAVENDKVIKISVETGITNDKLTEVKGNIKESMDIITEGQNLLSDGEIVKIIK